MVIESGLCFPLFLICHHFSLKHFAVIMRLPTMPSPRTSIGFFIQGIIIMF